MIKAYLNKAKECGVNKTPAVAVDDKLPGCCQAGEITRESLIDAGIGRQNETSFKNRQTSYR
jgi:hypothetical protein